MFKKIKELLFINKTLEEKKSKLKDLENSINNLNTEKEKMLKDIEGEKRSLIEKRDLEVNAEVETLRESKAREVSELETKFAFINSEIDKKYPLLEEIQEHKTELGKLEKRVISESRKVENLKFVVKSINAIYEKYKDMNILSSDFVNIVEEDVFEPTVELKLNCMDIKDLRKAFKDNQKVIDTTLEKFESRYTTKANMAIYRLMVIALKAEQQNVLYNLKYEKLEKSIEDIKTITNKYISIAECGNQSIASTLIKFINEVEYLFIKAIEIEYEYYIKKEKQKQEQAAIREQMKQEAEERKLLEKQQKQIEKEEEKYLSEIANVEKLIAETEDEVKLKQLQTKMLEIKNQLDMVEEKKEEITKRQNGRAGYVYVISNLGSFGDSVFKVGMTRRLDPMERIKELGNASVPFEFDIHSFIFSENAPALEKSLHDRLSDKRLNKINLRREFFETTVDDLEQLVQEVDPAAEFNKTMLAEQYRQSLAIDDLEEVNI